MSVLYTNRANTVLSANITNSQTTITLNTGTGALFPSPTGGDFFYGTIVSATNPNVYEIVKCTARSTDSLTVVRAQEGTTGNAFSASDVFALLPTAASNNAMRNIVSLPTSTGSANAQAVTNTVPLANLVHGALQTWVPGFTNTGPLTLAVDGTAVTAVLSAGVACIGGETQLDVPVTAVYSSVNSSWNIIGRPATLGTLKASTIAALRLLSGLYDGQTLLLDGYYAEGDGGGGQFFWNASSTTADNGGTIIAPTGVATGRWCRVYSGAPYVVWFGADSSGGTDTTVNIQNALTFCNGGDYLIWNEGTYKISATLNVSSRIANIANGYVTLNFTGTNSTLVHISSAYDGVTFAHCQGATFSNGFYFYTTDDTNSGIYLGDSGTTYELSNKRILDNCSVGGFKDALLLANECWGISFVGCNFYSNINAIATVTSLTNSGERISFIDCTFTDITGSVIENLSSTTYVDYYFMDCSFDYNAAIMDSNNVACHVNLVGCHIEYSETLVSQFNVNGGSLRIGHSSIAPTASVASFITMSGNAMIDARNNDFSGASPQTNAFCTMSGANAGTFLYDRNDELFNFYWPNPVTGAANGTPGSIVATNPSVGFGTVPVSGTVYQNTTNFTVVNYLQITFSPTTTVDATATVYVGPTSGALTTQYVNTLFANSTSQSLGVGLPVIIPPGWYWKIVTTNCTIYAGGVLSGM